MKSGKIRNGMKFIMDYGGVRPLLLEWMQLIFIEKDRAYQNALQLCGEPPIGKQRTEEVSMI